VVMVVVVVVGAGSGVWRSFHSSIWPLRGRVSVRSARGLNQPVGLPVEAIAKLECARAAAASRRRIRSRAPSARVGLVAFSSSSADAAHASSFARSCSVSSATSVGKCPRPAHRRGDA
jgi:hypothetical protein